MSDTTEFTRSATIEDLKLLIRALNAAGAEYVLIGGYALHAHGYQRATTDIDILVPANSENGEKVIKALMVFPDQVAKDILPEWFVDIENDDNGNIRVMDEIVIDVMLNACGETYESLMKHMEVIDFHGIPLQTIDLHGLLKTKQTLREKDINDRLVLEGAIHRINRNNSRDKP